MITVYVLTTLNLDSKGDVFAQNVGVTLSDHEAEAHRAKGIEYDFETFQVSPHWKDHAAASELVIALRELRSIVEAMQRKALR